jgi:hypothetical protein
MTWKPYALFSLSLCAIAQEPALLEREPQGWTDIIPGPRLEGWTRLPILPDPSPAVSQWRLENGVLFCEGDKGHEWLRYDKVYEDFVLHVEYRYRKLEGNPRYNSGIFVRTTPDYDLWYQAQIGGGQGGWLFGYIMVDGLKRRFTVQDRLTENRIKPAGEWNTIEVTAKGSTLSVWANGATVSEYFWVTVERGHVGLEAEGFPVEFRNLKIKTLPSTRVQ